MANISRNGYLMESVLITNALNTTREINFDEYACATLHLPSDWTTATLTLYSWSPTTGGYVPLYDSSGTAVTMTSTASSARVLSDAIFPSQKIKIVSDQAGNNAKPCGLTLKG